MNNGTRYIHLLGSIAICLSLLSATNVRAQNFGANDAVAPEEEDYSAVTLSYSQKEQGLTEQDIVPIPDYILEASHYTLGVEDVINISVMRHGEVSGDYIINGEGKIQYEFIGDIRIEGMTKDEVKDILVQKLSEFIISPDVNVKIVGYNSKIVYVIGEVGSPGKIYMRGDTITVREALVQAGLPLLSAKVADVRLITPSDTGKIEKKGVNVHKLLFEGDLRENLEMKPGDTLYIPPTFLAKTLRVMKPVADPISQGRRMGTGF